jgi:DNA-binding HxlR family transcriptional regulator
VIPSRPAHTEYYPTEKGMAVQRILAEIASFSIKYEPEIIFVDKKARNNMNPLFGARSLSKVYDFGA